VFEYIVNHFNEQIDIASINTESLTPYIAEAAHLLAQTLTQGSAYTCTNSTHFAAGFEFNRLLIDTANGFRPSLPSLFLNQNLAGLRSPTYDLSQQLIHLAKPSDILVVFASEEDGIQLQQCLLEAKNLNLSCLLIAPEHSELYQKFIQQNHSNASVIPLPQTSAKHCAQLQFSLAHLLVELVNLILFGQAHSE